MTSGKCNVTIVDGSTRWCQWKQLRLDVMLQDYWDETISAVTQYAHFHSVFNVAKQIVLIHIII